MISKKTKNTTSGPSACYEPFHHLFINPNGATGPCCDLQYVEENLTTRSLKEVWYGKRFARLRSNLRNKRRLGRCSRCNIDESPRNQEIGEKFALGRARSCPLWIPNETQP